MFPLLCLVGIGSLVFFAMKRSGPGPIDVSKIPGAAPPVGPPSIFKGPSGTTWLVEEIKIEKPIGLAGEKQFDVILNDPNVPAIPHMVLRYAIKTAADSLGPPSPSSRIFVKKGETAPEILARAGRDFGFSFG